MRTSVRSWMVLSALLIPGCTLVLNQERRWTDAGAEAPMDAPGLDAALDPSVDAPRLPDAEAIRTRMTIADSTRPTVPNSCPADGYVVYADPAGGPDMLDEALGAFPSWGSFAMLGNSVEVTAGTTPSASIPSHAIWMDADESPHVTWLEDVAETGTYRIPWDIDEVGPGREYAPVTGTPFVLARADRFIAGGGDTLVVCPNDSDVVVSAGPCEVIAPAGRGPIWGGFGPDDRAIVAQQVGSDVRFTDFTEGDGFPSSGMLRQPTGNASSALYSENTLFIVSTGSPYTVTPITLPTPRDTRVSFDGTSYLHATITPSDFNVVVSSCAGDSCSAGATTTITLADEALVDWNFHALSGGVRVAVLLTRDSAAPIALGTHVSVAMWRAGEVGPVIPLRIASGRIAGASYHGQGRSIESVAELSGAQLDVYVSALVNFFPDSAMSMNEDRIYLSGFRLCL